MSNELAVANSIAAVDKRFESMSLLAEMLTGQLGRQRQEFQQIKSAIASQVPCSGANAPAVPPGDISPEMLG